VRETLVGLEIDVPAPFLENFSSALTPLVTNNRISISMAHEDWGLLFQISMMKTCRARCEISILGIIVTLLGLSLGTMSLSLPRSSR
jgi:hypothetical protein